MFKNNRKQFSIRGFIRTTLVVITLSCVSSSMSGQTNHSNPWAPTRIDTLPPIASLTDGVWLKGELHVHSRHSKDSSNNPVKKIIVFSESVGMDFICITDHDNHVNGDVANNTWIDPEFKSNSVLLLYGAEWTTVRGHGNVFSARPYDHQRLYDVRDQRDVVVGAVKKELGVHLSANHPSGKDHFGYSYDIVNSIEVWNSAVWPKNANAIMIWDDMLSSGRKLTGRGGSDAHHGVPETPAQATKSSYQAKANYVGTPTTWVFATARTSQAVIDALSNGRVSVGANPYTPRVEFYADLNQDGKMDMMMGDNAISTGKPVNFRIQLTGKKIPEATYTVKVVKNGNPFNTYKMTGIKPVIEFIDTPQELGRTYYRVVVEGTPAAYPQVPESMALTGNMVGLSNPIFFNFDPNF
ncbi:CehA/McbA family metallohydrolase [uncultured Bacteroides sp.]|uniref:CehA/McbA family metallohydrolase n=1 Tax=uncultured Bacteroides sp. TaxID=162156 RepID=UPI002AA76846|nr:CehA/McbA family metallohydrolase [uncultured Bacteroides sp.]